MTCYNLICRQLPFDMVQPLECQLSATSGMANTHASSGRFRKYCCIMVVPQNDYNYSESILSFKNFPFLPEKLMELGMRLHSSYRGRSEVTPTDSTVRAATAASQWSMLKPLTKFSQRS